MMMVTGGADEDGADISTAVMAVVGFLLTCDLRELTVAWVRGLYAIAFGKSLGHGGAVVDKHTMAFQAPFIVEKQLALHISEFWECSTSGGRSASSGVGTVKWPSQTLHMSSVFHNWPCKDF
jgi:hypothetical protein